jgi:hypothetical protein
MAKKKRIYNAEVSAKTSLLLETKPISDEKNENPDDKLFSKRQIFSPEMISRLADKIKKL